MIYIYESHLGGLYYSKKKIPFLFRYCATCGDWDCLICSIEDANQAYKYLKKLKYDKKYIKNFIKELKNGNSDFTYNDGVAY